MFTHSAKECATRQETGRTCSRKSWLSMAKQQDHSSGGEDSILSGSTVNTGGEATTPVHASLQFLQSTLE
jgi:hypothetical protein